MRSLLIRPSDEGSMIDRAGDEDPMKTLVSNLSKSPLPDLPFQDTHPRQGYAHCLKIVEDRMAKVIDQHLDGCGGIVATCCPVAGPCALMMDRIAEEVCLFPTPATVGRSARSRLLPARLEPGSDIMRQWRDNHAKCRTLASNSTKTGFCGDPPSCGVEPAIRTKNIRSTAYCGFRQPQAVDYGAMTVINRQSGG